MSLDYQEELIKIIGFLEEKNKFVEKNEKIRKLEKEISDSNSKKSSIIHSKFLTKIKPDEDKLKKALENLYNLHQNLYNLHQNLSRKLKNSPDGSVCNIEGLDIEELEELSKEFETFNTQARELSRNNSDLINNIISGLNKRKENISEFASQYPEHNFNTGVFDETKEYIKSNFLNSEIAFKYLTNNGFDYSLREWNDYFSKCQTEFDKTEGLELNVVSEETKEFLDRMKSGYRSNLNHLNSTILEEIKKNHPNLARRIHVRFGE
jgi:L-2-hydroxyglutarate oxidase LhgO